MVSALTAMEVIFCLIVLQLAYSLECTDPVWCNVQVPSQSHFKFTGPIDPLRWKEAQALAASGRQVFAEEIRKIFTHPFDYLDGDKAFKNIEALMDYFIDPKTMLSPIAGGFISTEWRKRYAAELIAHGTEDEKYIRRRYESIYSKRAPVMQIGGFRYSNEGRVVSVRGNAIRGPDRTAFMREFTAAEKYITRPAIFVCALNENWGWMSTTFPNRTNSWGRYPKPKQFAELKAFLDSPKTVMMVINQHSNFSHPKLLALPRGIPLQWEGVAKIVWDALEYVVSTNMPKSHLLVSMSSTWGPRPQILACISKKFPQPEEFHGHIDRPNSVMAEELTQNNHLEKRATYYIKLSRGRFVLMLPGLGYDCFRNWELLLMGSIGIIERGVGYDRSYWRLPVLLVDDFYDVTPDLLRSAYVEAVYRRKEFEYERLKQSYWYSVIYNVSVTGHAGPMIDKFPMEAETPNFVRPLVPFHCGKDFRRCGSPIRTPERSC